MGEAPANGERCHPCSGRRHRWLITMGAIFIQMPLEVIDAWGVFTGDLTDSNGYLGFYATQTQWILSMGLASFAAPN